MFQTSVNCCFFFDFPPIKHGSSYSKYIQIHEGQEVQLKLMWIRVSARFELSGVNCIYLTLNNHRLWSEGQFQVSGLRTEHSCTMCFA